MSSRVIAALALLLSMGQPIWAAVPQRLNYQGKLADASGDPLSGSYSFRFKLFPGLSGGSALFSEDVTGANAVSVVNGIYTVQIGSFTSGGIPYGVFDGSELYLEIDVNPGSNLTGAETLTPRERLNSSAWAVHALGAERLGTGAVIATFTSTGHLFIPSGVTTTSGTFTTTGNNQYSLQTSSGISAGGGVVASFFSGMHVGDGSRLTNLPTGTDSTKVAKTGDTMTGGLTMSGASANIVSGSSVTTSGGLFGSGLAVTGLSTLAGVGAHVTGSGLSPTSGSGIEISGGATPYLQAYNRTGSAFVPLRSIASYMSFEPNGSEAGRFDSTGLVMAVNKAVSLSGASGNVISQSSITTTGGLFGNGAGITNLTGANVTGTVANATNATTVTNGVYTTGSYNDPAWITRLATAKIDLSTVTTALAGKQTADADLDDLADGSLTGSKVGSGVPGANVSGAVASATALAANGANCSAGNAPLGVDASGAAEGCFDVGTQAEVDGKQNADADLDDLADGSLTGSKVGSGVPAANIAAGTAGISITGNAATATSATSTRYVSSPDGDRANHIAPNALVRALQLDFKNASAVGGTGNYSGVMTYSPWDGTTGSTGDPSYQLAFYSNVANGTLPRMRIRSGIDTTWNSWYDIWNASSDGSGSGLDADLLDGMNAATAATGSTIMSRDASGDSTVRYLFSSYLNMSHAASGATTDSIFYSSTDDYIRKNNATGFRASLNVPTRTGGDASGTWGISVTGSAGSVAASGVGAGQYAAGNREMASASNVSTSYADAALELRESSYGGTSGFLAPRLSFHWGGVVASQISMESTGRISIRDNPGTGYENLIARDLWASRDTYFGTGGSYKVTSAGAGTFATSTFGGLMPTADNVGAIGLSTQRWSTARAVNFYGAYNAGPDLAERYPASEPVEPGDVVLFDPNAPKHATVFDQSKVVRGNEVGGKKIPVAVKKASTPYQAGLLGVISTAPGVKLHDPDDETNPPVALIGRVPVKVCNENGPIKIGDRLTSSSRPGYAMRATDAGPAIAIALQAFDDKQGKILAFVQAGEANVSEQLKELRTGLAELRRELEQLKSAR